MDLTEGSDLSELAYSSRPTTLISSVGGFSQPAIESVKSWSDLVRSLQPLKLPRYESSRLHESCLVGEGVSYIVFRSNDILSGSSVAVKKIKLPLSPFNESPSRARIGSILRDIEVMSHTPLAQHRNILSILGYGWELRAGTLLPFVVTEYASLGSLREYLMRDKIDARTRRELCYQVAAGLHELHLSSIAHGDLKLENVLVIPAEEIHTRKNRIPVLAKLSDFGHSLRFAPGTNLSLQRYQGTMWYNPPEVAQGRSSAKDTNLRKCDVWALGLFCWEVHRNGIPYYKDICIQNLFSKAGSLDDQNNTNIEASSRPSLDSTETISCELLKISHFVAAEAQGWVDQALKEGNGWQHFDRILLKAVFKNTLKADPVQRTSNVSHLPLVHGNRDLRERSILMESRLEEAQWSFAIFLREQMSQIPLGVKTEMLTDFKQLASRPHDSSEAVARAALHVAFAHATSFGIIDSKPELIRSLIQKSVAGGLHIAICMKDLLETGLCNDGSVSLTSNTLDSENYNRTLKYTIKTLAKLGFAELKGISPTSTFASLLHAAKAVNQESLVAHYSVLCHLTDVLPAKYVNIRSPISGETALALACRLGDYKAAQNLLDRGADPSICTADNCSPLHWIFMFDEEAIKTIDLSFFSGVNRMASRPQILDAQLPTDMEGTPLSFAVAAASIAVVDALLVKFKGEIEPSAIRQACHKASSLYLHDIVERLYHCVDPDPNPFSFLNLEGLAKSSLVIQKLIHCSGLKMAACLTVDRISEAMVKCRPLTYDNIGEETPGRNHGATNLTQWILEGATSAIHVGDLDLAQLILDTFSRKYVKLSQASAQLLAVEVSRVCAETAAGSIHTLPVSLQLLDFASHQSVRCGYKNNWVTSITTAIEYHRKDIFLHLLQRPHNVNSKNAEGMTVLHAVLRYHFQSMCPLATILLTGANPDIADNFGRTPLHLAIELGMDQEFDRLLTRQADIVTFDIYGSTPLHTALLCKRLSIIASILGHYSGPKLINELGERRRSPLALAALEGLETATRLLLKAGACLGTIDADQRTPLHLAASGNTPGHLAVISLLLSKPEGVNVVDRNGNTSFNVFMMTQAGQHTLDLELCRCFLAAGTDLTISNKDGYSPILLSLDLFELTIFKRLLPLLVQYGANINDRDQNSLSPLDVASLYGQADLTVCLLQHGALVNAIGNLILGGPLHCCVNQSNFSFSVYMYSWQSLQKSREKAIVAQHLLRAGADILERNKADKPDSLSLEAFPNGKSSLMETKNRNWYNTPDIEYTMPETEYTVPETESSSSSLLMYQQYPIFSTLHEDNDLTRVLIQAHYEKLGPPSSAVHLEVLQQSFDHAIDIESKAIAYFLEARVPVDFSSLCTLTTAGSDFLAWALYSDNKMMIQRCRDYEFSSRFQIKIGITCRSFSSWGMIATSPSMLETLKLLLARLIEVDSRRKVAIARHFGQVIFSVDFRGLDRTSIEVALDPVLKRIFSNEDVHFEDCDVNSSELPR